MPPVSDLPSLFAGPEALRAAPLDPLTATPGHAPDPADYDVWIINLSGGKDGLIAGMIAAEKARAAGREHILYTAHANLGLMDWPAVTVDGVRWPSASELAAQHSALLGIPPERHFDVRATRPDETGARVNLDLLTVIAERGLWPWLGPGRYCTPGHKTRKVFEAFTAMARVHKKRYGRPLVCLNSLGLRADESRDRANRRPYRNLERNSQRTWDEWLPAHHVTTDEVKSLTDEAGWPYQWCYDSAPGALDWRGSSRCSCSHCTLANQRDLLLAVGRRPLITELYAEVETARGVPFRRDWSMADLMARARKPNAPHPGIVIEDEGPEFPILQAAVRDALTRPSRRALLQAAARQQTISDDGCGSCSLAGPA